MHLPPPDLLAVAGAAADSPWPLVTGAAGVAVAGVGGGLVLVRHRRRRRQEADRARTAGPFPDETPRQLTARADAALLAVDEAVRRSQLDLDAGRLQHGAAAVAESAAALDAARDRLTRAFRLRQQLDEDPPGDSVPGDPGRDDAGLGDGAGNRRWLVELLGLMHDADARLTARAAEFAALRDLEHAAADVAAGLEPRLTALAGRLPAEEDRLAALRRRWAVTAVAPVRDSVDRARARLAAAGQALTGARAEAAAGRPGAAATAVRSAEEAVATGQALLDAVGRRDRELTAAVGGAAAARDELTAGIDAARSAGAASAGLAAVLAAAQRALEEADRLAAAPGRDPEAALALLDAAGDDLDAALDAAGVALAEQRDVAGRVERALGAARAAVRSAATAVGTDRPHADTGCRTRLSAAQRHLAQAEAAADTDPATVLREASRSAALALEAHDRLPGTPPDEVPGGVSDAASGGASGGVSGGVGSGFGGSDGRWSAGGRWPTGRGS